ncbi:FAD-binding and (Fe-S)-binding domain-containing protein [Angustibacter peucedani]
MSELVEALRAAGVASADDSGLRRSLYASDASLYRVPPQAVVVPRDTDEVLAAAAVCRELGVPLTMRGAGTSIAGNAVGPGVVVDVSRHLDRVLELDPERGTARVEPGVVQASLQRAAAPHGLRFGPDPSTHNRATLGGMIGNNACGSRALGYGRTSDNVHGLDVVTGSGERLRLGSLGRADDPPSATLDALRRVVDANLAVVRTELGRFGRQVSGYSLEHLLPENGFDVARALVGSEGTLALTLQAEVRLVRDEPVRVLVVLGYPSMAEAADAVTAVLPHGPVACEGLDARIVDVVRARRGPAAVPPMPRGEGWLFAELTGTTSGDVLARAEALARDAGALAHEVVTDPAQAAALWRIREDGAGLSGRTPAGDPAHAGWEDAAVPPERLGAYLREFDALMAEHRLTGLPYGHFGDGCLHIRIDFPFDRADGTAVFRSFLLDAGRLAAAHGGSMSGEHGDGRARSELLPLMYSPAAIALFERVKGVFDPADLLNPGVVVRPAPFDADVRVAAAPPYRQALGLAYRHDRGDLSTAVHRCTGVGKCRADTTTSGGVMCPSFLATRDEKDSTRGRARVLQEAVAGHLGRDPWRSPEVHDALDLCLSCKGCSSDCPTGIDMAAYKAEALHQRYRRRLRPRAHYALGWLPRWARLVGRVPGLARAVNALLRLRVLHPVVTAAAGVDARRGLPTFAQQTFRDWFDHRDTDPGTTTLEALVFVDTFTDAFAPEVGRAAVEVLEAAGYRVSVTREPVCCGLTWISTGQLDGARRQVRATVRALLPHVERGAVVVGLEPSCTGVLRSDALELLDDADLVAAQQVAAATRTLAEVLTATPGWSPPDLSDERGIAQPHCHHHAVMGWAADAALLAEGGAQVQRLGGCCGLAGNFGVERGHHDVSVAVAETALLPAVRDLDDGGLLLADGFSCRTQLDDLAAVRGEHLAQLLARHLPPAVPARSVEDHAR